MGAVVTGVAAGVDERTLPKRALATVAVTGLICALVAVVAAWVALSFSEPRYRAQTQLALLPGPLVPTEEVADYWDALSSGQAARIAAEVLSQRRWVAPAAQAAGVPAESVSVSAGAVSDTSLIDLGVEASSPQAAEQAVDALVREARPVVEQVSGPYVLEVVQPVGGSATPTGMPPRQVLAVIGVTALVTGFGVALLVIRRRGARGAGSDVSDRADEPTVSGGGPAPARPDDRATRPGNGSPRTRRDRPSTSTPPRR